MRLVLCAFAALLIPTTSAFSMTGTDLVAARRDFAEGFIFGAASSRLEIMSVDSDRQLQLQSCFTNSGITSTVLMDAVLGFIGRNPDALPRPATVAVLRTMNEICP